MVFHKNLLILFVWFLVHNEIVVIKSFSYIWCAERFSWKKLFWRYMFTDWLYSCDIRPTTTDRQCFTCHDWLSQFAVYRQSKRSWRMGEGGHGDSQNVAKIHILLVPTGFAYMCVHTWETFITVSTHCTSGNSSYSVITRRTNEIELHESTL